MANRTTFVDITDGDYLFEGYYNDLRSKTVIRRNISTEDTSEYNTGLVAEWTSLGYSKTFTIPDVGADNMVLAIKLTFDSKYATQQMLLRASLGNDDLGGSATLVSTNASDGAGGNTAVLTDIAGTSYATNTYYLKIPTYISVGGGADGSLQTFNIYNSATYTLTFSAKDQTNGVPGIAYIKNITAEITWTYLEDSEVSGWA